MYLAAAQVTRQFLHVCMPARCRMFSVGRVFAGAWFQDSG
jgi:hypothetical protein